MANPNGTTFSTGTTSASNVVSFGGQRYVVTAANVGDVFLARTAYLEKQYGRKLTFSERAATEQALRSLIGVAIENGENYDPKTGVDTTDTMSTIKTSVAQTLGDTAAAVTAATPSAAGLSWWGLVAASVAAMWIFKRM